MTQHENDIIPHQDEVEQVVDQHLRIKRTVADSEVITSVLNGWTVGGSGDWGYLTGGEAALGLALRHVGAVALAKGSYSGNSIVGHIEDALRPIAYSAARGEIHVFGTNAHVCTCTVAIDTDGTVYVVSDIDVSSTAQLYVLVSQLRLALADPEAAREFVASLPTE